ncbi:SAP domain-containing protein [Carnobacterium mobile]
MGIFSTFKSLFKNDSNSKDTTGEVTINEIDPILTKKTTIGLTPGEIILLDWCNGTLEHKLFPQYFKYNYDVDGRKSVKKLINQEFLEYGSYNNQLESLKVKELKEILANNNLTSTGKKADLIEKIIESAIKVNDLPNTYSLTFKGRETVRDYEHIILAHKDKYFDVSNAIFYKNKLPYPYGYGDLKWAYLGTQTLEHTKNKEFGLLRNTYLAKADHLDKEKKYLNALSQYIVVVLLDASGLTNGYRLEWQQFF